MVLLVENNMLIIEFGFQQLSGSSYMRFVRAFVRAET
jgi:hypothetical protein